MRPIIIFLLLFSAFKTFANFSRDSIYIERCYGDRYDDTVVTNSGIKYHNTYNNNNQLIERIALLDTGVWVNSSRETFNYDTLGNNIRRQFDLWISGAWQNNTLDSFQYNPGGKIILSAHYVWSGIWMPDTYRNIIAFSPSDSILTILQQIPNGVLWINEFFTTHIRNVLEKDSVVFVQRWNGSAWIDSTKIIHHRNNAGTDTIILFQSWDGLNWLDFGRNYYSIDSQQRILSDTSQHFSGGLWINDHLHTYNYDTFGYGFTTEFLIWSSVNSDFVPVERFIYSIDLHHRVSWMHWNFDWDPDEYYFYSQSFGFDTAGRIIYEDYDCISACSGSGVNYYYDSNGYLIREVHWNFNMGDEYYEDVCEYYFTSISSNSYICDSGFTILSVDSAASYLWSNGETTRQITVDSSGNYQARLIYADGVSIVTAPTQVVILSSHPATHATDSTATVCQYNSVYLNVDPQLHTTYQWIRNDTIIPNDTLSFFAAHYNIFNPGRYQVIVTNPCGTDTSSSTFLQSGIAPIASVTGPNFMCNGDTTTLIGHPIGNYTYEWSSWALPDGNGPIYITTTGGNFYMRVTDSLGCRDNTIFHLNYGINPPVPLIIQIGNSLWVTNNTNAQIKWYLNGNIIPSAVSATYIPIQTGNYSVSFTQNTICIKYSLDYYFNASVLMAQAGNSIARVCPGNNVVLGMGANTVFGGTAPYSYSWTPNISLNNSTVSTPTANPLFTTTYHLTITDGIGNTAHDSIVVIVDSIPDATIISSTGSYNFCSNRSPYFSAPGVRGNSWQWTRNGLPYGTSSSIFVYQPGTYRLIVTSQFGCRDTSTVVANAFQYPTPLPISISGQPVACGGNGVALYVPNNPALTYQWFDETGDTLPGETDTIFYPIVEGSWILTITDSNQCFSTTYSNNVRPDSTLLIQPITISDSNFCINSSIDLYASQINGYTYQWYWNGFDIPGATSIHYQTTWPGYYQIYCNDTNGCSGVAAISIYNIFPPDSLHIESYGSDLLATGEHYSLQWYLNGVAIPNAYDTIYHPVQPGIYTVKNIYNTNQGICGTLSAPFEVFCSVTFHQTNVPCDHSCIGEISIMVNSGATPQILWSNGSSDTLLQQLCEGNYFVSVIDSAGCNIVDSIKIDVINPVNIQITAVDVSCFDRCDGDLYFGASGGSNTYSWKINGADTTITIYNHLCPGQYLIGVDDGFGCVDSELVTIATPPHIVISVLTLLEPTCSGSCDGEIELVATGGIGDLDGYWQDGSFGFIRFSLCDTNYIFIVNDLNGCTVRDTLTINAVSTLQNNLNVSAPTCQNSCDGQISVTTTNGISPYSYSWSNGQTGSTITACTGNIMFTVTDSAGCNLTESIYVSSLDSVFFTSTISGTNCIGCTDGKIYINPVLDQSPYLITWQPMTGVLHNDTISDLPAGNYFICLTDNNSCIFCDSVFVLDDPTSVARVNKPSIFNVYPNPFHEFTTVNYPQSDIGLYSLDLKDLSGRIIRNYKNIPTTIKISGEGLSEGIYFISVLKNEILQWVEKVVIY